MAGGGLRLLGCGVCTRRNEAVVLLVIDEPAELLDGLGGDECLLEVGIHDHRGKLRENGEMLVIRTVGGGDHEEEAARIAVHRGKVHSVRDGHGSQACRLHAVALGVRRCNAVAEARCAALLADEHILDVLLFIAQIASLFHIICEEADGLFLRGGSRNAEGNALGLQKIVDMQGENLLFSNYTIVSRSASVSARVARFGENAEAEPAATPM